MSVADTSVKIAKIGDRIKSENSSNLAVNSEAFILGHRKYLLAIEIDIAKVKRDVRVVGAFNFERIQNGLNFELWLTFLPNYQSDRSDQRCLLASKSLIETFFITSKHAYLCDEHETEEKLCEETADSNEDRDANGMDVDGDSDNDENNSNSNVVPKWIADDLYQQLREWHKIRRIFDNDQNVQHNDLLAELTPYQIDGVKWMLNREKLTDYYPSGFQEVKRRWFHNDTTKFYFNPISNQLRVNHNADIAIPSGGILADTMGLGKTVEMLDLILLNQRGLENVNDRYSADKTESRHERQEIRCLITCSKSDYNNTVKCIRCQLLQHRNCVSHQSSKLTPDKYYICPHCWQNEEPVKAKTTIVVSPAAIKMQWKDEVLKHVDAKSGDLKILIYNGLKYSKRKWFSPLDLASYDIILIDYTTLESEFDYIDRNPSRRSIKPLHHIPAKSPLLNVNWWRVCLDEAQMVRSSISKQAQLVARLSAVHRWVVTGTPIQESIDDLCGLISFLGCSPYNEHEEWNYVKNEFQLKNNFKPILNVLEPIMWRTCKSKDIVDQINIPKQTEIVHFVQMTDVENYHYKTVHEQCWNDFHLRAQAYGPNRQLATLDPTNLKKLLQPFSSLRHDCSAPRIDNQHHKMPNLDELLQHLLEKTQTEAEMELQNVGWSLNGIAVVNGVMNFGEAAKIYQQVLKLEAIYDDKVTLDLLVRIHAVHNLLLIDNVISSEERKTYEADLIKFEAKYLEGNVECVASCQRKLDEWKQKIERKVSSIEDKWWTDALKENSKDLLKQIQKLVKSPKLKKSDGGSIVKNLVQSWMDMLILKRKEIQKVFDKLRIVSNNLKPVAELPKRPRETLVTFLKHVNACHLQDDLSDPPKKRQKIEPCQLCDAKGQLETYKSVIFQKKIIHLHDTADREKKNTRVIWKISYQESILKTIRLHIRRVNNNNEDGNSTMEYLNKLRCEFKDCCQLLVNINDTIKVYNEIDFCKSNIKSSDINLQTKTLKYCHMTSWNVLAKFNMEKQHAEIKLKQLIGRLKYFDHLRKDKKLEECPVCLCLPEDTYVVLECGHHMCKVCIEHFPEIFHCATCRQEQQKSELYGVSLLNEKRLTNSSSKIEKIIKTIIDLRHKEANVKVVIFSQSTDTLMALRQALDSTIISYRNPYRSDLNGFHRKIEEFKDQDNNVTCLLLPLSFGSNGLNLIEATHVFLIEPIMNPGEELQAISRIHRIGQTKETYVHRFIVQNTIEQSIYKAISQNGAEFWSSEMCTMGNLIELFSSSENLAIDN